MNIDLAFHVATEMARLGITEVCLCAGARNSPLVSVFSETSVFKLYHFFEERSASFFALGRIKAHGRPVAVITTSGTAVAELLPAAMEAHYSGLALLLVTADRPRRYRGTGAPQSVEQVGIFGPYARFTRDWAVGDSVNSYDSLNLWDCRGPAQINLCFEEPLLDRCITDTDRQKISSVVRTESCVDFKGDGFQKLDQFLEQVKRPLVILGGGIVSENGQLRKTLINFLLQLGSPVYIEATSGLRECAELESIRIQSTDRLLEKSSTFSYPINGVLRIGGVPTLRFWRDLEEKRSDLPVLSISDCPFSGSTRSDLIVTSIEKFFLGYELKTIELERKKKREIFSDFFVADRKYYRDLLALLEQEPLSECGMIHALSKKIPIGSRVYLGNSLPIREWDLAASRSDRGLQFTANRGANGIDGQVSSFLGFSEPGKENWAFLGDLTTLYDLAGPWIIPQIPDLNIKLVVINNGGGKIFSRMFKNPVFQNEHEISFAPWAALWNLGYQFWSQIPDSIQMKGNQLIELRPDPAATARFWNAYDRIFTI